MQSKNEQKYTPICTKTFKMSHKMYALKHFNQMKKKINIIFFESRQHKFNLKDLSQNEINTNLNH